MLAFALMLGLLAAPFVLWAIGLEGLAILVGVFVALSVPSMIYVTYLAIKTRTLPKITGGPSIEIWPGKRIGL